MDKIEKTASQWIDEAFEKEAAPMLDAIRTSAKKTVKALDPKTIKRSTNKGALQGALAGGVGGAFVGAPATGAFLGSVLGGKGGKKAAVKAQQEAKKKLLTAGGVAAGTAGLVGGTALLNKKKKEEKTASELIDEAYGVATTEKTASEVIDYLFEKAAEFHEEHQRTVKKKKKTASETIEELLKQAEMNVPTEEEKKKANNVAVDEPLRDIACEVCGYKGKPDNKGFCPECGTLGGIKPRSSEYNREDETMVDGTTMSDTNIYEESLHSFDE